MILGVTEAPQTVSFERPGRTAAGARPDPAPGSGRREHLVVHRRGRHQRHAEQRARADQPETARRSARRRQHDHPAAAGQGRRPAPASRSTCRRCRTSRSRIASAARSISTASSTRIRRSSICGRRGCSRRCGTRRRCRTSRPISRTAGCGRDLTIDRDTASRFGITAQNDGRHALQRLRPAAGLHDLHAAEPVPRHPRTAAAAIGADPMRSPTFTSPRPTTGKCRCWRSRRSRRPTRR